MKDYQQELYNSDDYYDKDDKKDKRECYEKVECCKKEKKEKKDTKVAIACGQVCDDSVNVLECERKHQVATLEIDLKDFKDPIVKLDFSSIVAFRDLDTGYYSASNASFTLKLFRITDCCKKICIGTFDFARCYNDVACIEVGLFLAATRDSFGFTKCDHPKCDECVTYLVEVHDTTYDDTIITKLVLQQINFTAIAVDECK